MRKLVELFNSQFKYLFTAVFLGVVLYPKFPLIKVPGTYVSIRLEDILLVVLSVVTIIKIIPNIRKIITSDIEKSMILFFGAGLISFICGVLITETVSLKIGFLHWARRIEYLVPFFAVSAFINTKRTNFIDFIIKVMVVAVLIVFVYGYGQKHLSWPVIITQNEEYSKGIALRWIPGSHINSTFAGHYDLASFLVLILPVIVTAFFVLRGLKTRLVLGVTILSGLWLMSNAVSRISIVSYLAGTVFALFLARKYRAIPIVLIVSTIFFGFSQDLLSRYQRVIEVAQKKIKISQTYYLPVEVYAAVPVVTPVGMPKPTPTPSPIPVFEDRSTSIRLNVEWPRAIRAFTKNPFLGTGYSSITLATDNDYLRLLGETGALGFLAFSAIFLRIMYLCYRSLPLSAGFDGVDLAFLAGIVGCLPGVFLNAVFIDVFEASKFAIIFWMLMGYAVNMLRNSKYEH